MIQDVFSTLSTALTQSLWLALLSAFVWGILSILLSPCHLSSIPLVIGFILQQEKKTTRRAFSLALVFSLGILVSIAFIGIITASLGRLMGDLGRVGNILVAVVFFLVGLYLLDVIHLNWSFAQKKTKQHGWFAALLLGLTFGIALGPCTFAFVAPVLGIAFVKAQTAFFQAVLFILFFALGHCGIIVFFGSMAQKVQIYLNWTNESQGVLWVKRVCGILVMAGGLYLIVNSI